MEYTGKYRTIYSTELNQEVNILEYERTDKKTKIPYIACTRCGQGIIRKMYVVQDAKHDIELEYLGTECIKHFK